MEYVRDETRFGDLVSDWSGLSSTTLVVLAGLVVLALVLLGVVAWLRGRRVGSVLMVLVLVAAVAWFLTPVSWLGGRFAVDESNVSLAIEFAIGATLVLGLFAATRLAKPSSWWAQRLYASEKYDRSVERYGWSRIRAR